MYIVSLVPAGRPPGLAGQTVHNKIVVRAYREFKKTGSILNSDDWRM